MGVCSLVGGMLTLLLPETLGTLLIENTEDIDDLKSDGKPFFAFWSKRELQTHLDAVVSRKAAKATANDAKLLQDTHA